MCAQGDLVREQTSPFDFIAKMEKENIRKTKRQFSKEIRLYKKSFNWLVEVLDELYLIPMQRAKSITDMAVLPILSKIAMSLKSYLHLVMMGYYHEAVVLKRNILESVLKCMLVAKKPEYAVKWSKNRKLEPREVRKELGFESAADIFSAMSDYVHLNAASIGTFVQIRIDKQRAQMTANWHPRFDRDCARFMLIPILAPLMIASLSESHRDRLSADSLRKIAIYMKSIDKVWSRIVAESQNATATP